MAQIHGRVRKTESYIVEVEGVEFEVEYEPLSHEEPIVRKLPDGRTVIGYLCNDDNPYDPRDENDNFGTMICWHRRHALGDKHEYEDADALWRELIGVDVHEAIDTATNKELYDWADAHPEVKHSDKAYGDKCRELMARMRDLISDKVDELGYVILDLFLYDHSGITMSTSRSGQFADRWDSSAVGLIYVSGDDIKKNWSVQSLDDLVDYRDGQPPKPARERAADLLQCEVEEYDKFIMGETYIARVELFDADDCRIEEDDERYLAALGTEHARKVLAEMVEEACG